MRTLKKQTGFISIMVLVLLMMFVATGLSLFTVTNASLMDGYNMKDQNQARFLAESGLQEAKYLVENLNGAFSGWSAEHVVTAEVNGKTVKLGSYMYNVVPNGNTYNVSCVGFVPDALNPKKVSYTLTDKFTYDYFGVGVLVLGSGAGVFNMSGNARINIQGGKVIVNSTSNTAISITGGGASATAPEFDMMGTYSGSGLTGTVKKISNPIPDPLANLAAPDITTLTSYAAVNASSGDVYLQPGVYPGGIKASSTATLHLAPGVYYLDGGGISITGQANLYGAGVTIYNNPHSGSDSISLAGQGTIQLSAAAPQDAVNGAIPNVTIFQNRTSTVSASVSGLGAVTVSGTIYTPSATLNLSGNGTGRTVGSQQIVSTLNMSGNGAVTVNMN